MKIDDNGGDADAEFQIDEKTAALVETIAAELQLDPEELAREALRLGLVRHFEKN
jgi:hypothetical protein